MLHNPAAGMNYWSFQSLFFFSWYENGVKKAKGRLLQDSGGSWKGPVGFAEQREALGSSSLGVEKFLPHPSLISAEKIFSDFHLLSGCGSLPSCPSRNCSNSLSIFLGPFCSYSRCLPSAVPCPALFRLWYLSGFVGEAGEGPAGAGLSGAVADYGFMSPPSDVAGAALSVSFGRAVSMFALAEKHRHYLPLKGLFCCLCPFLPLTTSIPEALPA